MSKKTRREELIAMLEDDLKHKEILITRSPKEFTDAEFKSLIQEAIKLREMLRILKGYEL